MSCKSAQSNSYYRKDGVRIQHNPEAPGMKEHYGAPGQTDEEGFDPYADTVGPGIYGGWVKRDPSTGKVLIGRQYQDHNPTPGPIYAGGGYTDINRALGSGDAAIAALLDADPSLVNEISTGIPKILNPSPEPASRDFVRRRRHAAAHVRYEQAQSGRDRVPHFAGRRRRGCRHLRIPPTPPDGLQQPRGPPPAAARLAPLLAPALASLRPWLAPVCFEICGQAAEPRRGGALAARSHVGRIHPPALSRLQHRREDR